MVRLCPEILHGWRSSSAFPNDVMLMPNERLYFGRESHRMKCCPLFLSEPCPRSIDNDHGSMQNVSEHFEEGMEPNMRCSLQNNQQQQLQKWQMHD